MKTSLSISRDVLDALDRLAGPGLSRSAFVEAILRDYVEGRARGRREAREIAAINRHATRLDAEMQDVLTFQVSTDEE